MEKTFKIRDFAPLLLFSFILLFSIETNAQTEEFDQNIILKGKVYNRNNNSLYKNTSIVVIGFNKERVIKTNDKGEYEVNFNDNTGDSLSTDWGYTDGKILFGWGEDPNITQTIQLDINKIKKAKKKKKNSLSPTIIKIDVKLEFE